MAGRCWANAPAANNDLLIFEPKSLSCIFKDGLSILKYHLGLTLATLARILLVQTVVWKLHGQKVDAEAVAKHLAEDLTVLEVLTVCMEVNEERVLVNIITLTSKVKTRNEVSVVLDFGFTAQASPLKWQLSLVWCLRCHQSWRWYTCLSSVADLFLSYNNLWLLLPRVLTLGQYAAMVIGRCYLLECHVIARAVSNLEALCGLELAVSRRSHCQVIVTWELLGHVKGTAEHEWLQDGADLVILELFNRDTLLNDSLLQLSFLLLFHYDILCLLLLDSFVLVLPSLFCKQTNLSTCLFVHGEVQGV